MNEQGARRIVLAQAIETADVQGKLVSRIELDQIDRQSAQEARALGPVDSRDAVERFLGRRAERILQVVGNRNPALAALQSATIWQRTAPAAVPLGALLLGIFSDQIANPHQVNLLSKPLLLILLWNLLVYVALVAMPLVALGRAGQAPELVSGIRGWVAQLLAQRRRTSHLRSEIVAGFTSAWQAQTSALRSRRIARILHLCAAAWAVGVAFSLVFGGIWARYHVQWESTFLDARDVHQILRVLFVPVTEIFPATSFSLRDIEQLDAAAGLAVASEAGTGRRWVFMYGVLLALVVVIPRVALAAQALWRERELARRVDIDLATPYFERVTALLTPAQVRLGMYAARDEDRAALLRVLLRSGGPLNGMMPWRGEAHTLAREAGGGVLELVDLPPTAVPVEPPQQPVDSWFRKLGRWSAALGRGHGQATPPKAEVWRGARRDVDTVLHVVSTRRDFDEAAALLGWLGKPVLVLVRSAANGPHGHGDEEALMAWRPRAGNTVRIMGVLGFDQFARCWVQEPVLLDTIASCLPGFKGPGFERLAADRQRRHWRRFSDAMAALAAQLLEAARQTQIIAPPPSRLKSLIGSGERDAWERARQAAMDGIVQQLRLADAAAMAALLRLHDIDDSASFVINERLREEFVVAAGLPATQVALAGAATGAMMGAGLDLLVAGLSLGAATATGALVGGGIALVAAAWRSNANDAGGTIVQLSDEMMQALVDGALLRYLAVAHAHGADPGGAGRMLPAWKGEVVAAVQAHNAILKEHWAAARLQKDAKPPRQPLVVELEDLATRVLGRLYPGMRVPPTEGAHDA